MGISVRAYQTEAAKSVFSELDRGVRATMLEMATGTGKTFTSVMIGNEWIRQRDGRVMVIADQEELIEQWVEAIANATGHRPQVEHADRKASGSFLWGSRWVVASKDSLHERRLNRFNPFDFSLLILDECDKVVRKNVSWWSVLEYFYQNPGLSALGVTATPTRKDRVKLCFDTLAFKYDLMAAINDGYLVYPEQMYLSVAGLDYSRLSMSCGDYAATSLEEAFTEEKLSHSIVKPTLDFVGHGLTLVVSPTVAAAEQTAHIFNRWRPGCADYLSGETIRDKRRSTLDRFADGGFQFLCVCSLCTRGYDNPRLQYCVMNRMTKSLSLYLQTLGRITRTWPGVIDACATVEERINAIAASPKPKAFMIDPLGNVAKHKYQRSLADVFSYLGGAWGDRAVQEAVNDARAAGQPVDMRKQLVETQKRLDQQDEEARKQALIEAERKREEIRQAQIEAEERRRALLDERAGVRADVDYNLVPVDFFSEGSRGGKSGGGGGGPPTHGQIGLLNKMGIPVRGLTKSQAKKLIDQAFARRRAGACSIGQANVLARHGEDVRMPRGRAEAVLDILKARNWCRRDYALEPGVFSIRRLDDGRYAAVVRDSLVGDIILSRRSRNASQAQSYIQSILEM